jgi:hypothetical protein
MKNKLIAGLTALVALVTATACTQPLPANDTDRITFAIEAYYQADGVERSVLSQTNVVASITNLTTNDIHIRDGRSGAWLVLPWEMNEDFDLPIRYQFTYDRRDTKLEDFRLVVKALVNADRDMHLRCTLFDTNERVITRNEVVIDGSLTGTVSCAN